jgi:hypothetical protein
MEGPSTANRAQIDTYEFPQGTHLDIDRISKSFSIGSGSLR